MSANGTKRTFQPRPHLFAIGVTADIGPRTGALVARARIWREIFKFIRLAFPFF
jgi:hypothetical protein